MRKLVTLILGLAILLTMAAAPALAARQNDYPIVLVHGFMGWGRDEFLGYKYWGGFRDIQSDLTSYGYTTYTGTVGPVSSNWDRACELYAYIKGGTVDYGKVHSQKYGHARYGKTFTPGQYKDWGTLDAAGKIRKIHLVSHSQGGQTVRTLVQLLEQGSQEEINGTPAAELSPLFQGGKSWAASVTTISTPNDGTTLADGVNGFVPLAQQMIGVLAAGLGVASDSLLYDFKLDQWGLRREPGESFSSYSSRVWNSSIWKSSHDISAWDLSPDGARELNSWVRARPGVYYFSWSTEATFQEFFTGYEVPEITMNPLFTVNGFFMGAYTRNEPGHVTINSSWWKNDGVVNTNSMDGPTLNSTDVVVNYNGTPQVGKWNHMGLRESWDHGDIIGHTLWDVTGWYRSMADVLGALPKN